MSDRLIIGIAGRSGAGKDVIARYLVGRYGFRRIGFADALKREVATVLLGTLTAYAVERSGGRMPLSPTILVHRLLWEERTPMTRRLLQEWGTELRRAEDPDYWVKKWQEFVADDPAGRIVAPDVRYQNERDVIRLAGGLLFHVVRPGYSNEAAGHPSEQDPDDVRCWSAEFVNDGSIDTLQNKVGTWLTQARVL